MAAPEKAYQRGRQHLRNARYGLAIRDLRRALNAQPGSVDNLNALAIAWDNLGRFDIAARYFRLALTIQPNSFETLNNFGFSLIKQKKYSEAIDHLLQACRLNAASATANANLEAAAKGLAEQQRRLASLPGDTNALSGTQTYPRTERAGPKTHALLTQPREQAREAKRSAPNASVAGAGLRSNRPTSVAYRGSTATGLAQPSGVSAAFSGARDEAHDRRKPAAAQLRSEAEKITDKRRSSDAHEVALAPILAPPQRRSAKVVDVAFADAPQRVKTSVSVRALSGEPVEGNTQERRVAIVIANGTGRRSMAARFQDFLGTQGMHAGWLANADRYDHGTTVISYRPGYEREAERLAALLPVPVKLRKNGGEKSHVRMLLGADLLNFDEALMTKKQFRVV